LFAFYQFRFKVIVLSEVKVLILKLFKNISHLILETFLLAL
jgi:hypothetical protein